MPIPIPFDIPFDEASTKPSCAPVYRSIDQSFLRREIRQRVLHDISAAVLREAAENLVNLAVQLIEEEAEAAELPICRMPDAAGRIVRVRRGRTHVDVHILSMDTEWATIRLGLERVSSTAAEDDGHPLVLVPFFPHDTIQCPSTRFDRTAKAELVLDWDRGRECFERDDELERVVRKLLEMLGV